jgi:hypothetical protein
VTEVANPGLMWANSRRSARRHGFLNAGENINCGLARPILPPLILSCLLSHQVGRPAASQVKQGLKERPKHRAHQLDHEIHAGRFNAHFARWSQNQMPGAGLVLQNSKDSHKKGYGMVDVELTTIKSIVFVTS